jgi:hypothetical protein
MRLFAARGLARAIPNIDTYIVAVANQERLKE